MKDCHGFEAIPYVYGGPHNYCVVLPLQQGRKPKYFGIKKHGGAEQARKAAISFRDSKLTKRHLRAVKHAKGSPWSSRLRDKPASIKEGVQRLTTASGRKGWIGQITDMDDEKHSMAFYEDTHGEDALLFAIRFRLRAEKQYYFYQSALNEDQWFSLVKWFFDAYPKGGGEWKKIKHPGSLSQPDETFVQARMMIRKKQFSSSFTLRKYGGYNLARLAAIEWCLRTKRENDLSGVRMLDKASVRNKSTGIAGITRCIMRPKTQPELLFQVSTMRNGKPRPVKFSAGRVENLTPEKERIAFDAAKACRAHYEQCLVDGNPFNWEAWRAASWKQAFGWPSEAA